MDLPSCELGTVYLSFMGCQYYKTNFQAGNSIEPGQVVWMFRLAWYYTGGNGFAGSVPALHELIRCRRSFLYVLKSVSLIKLYSLNSAKLYIE